jgi:drug/metabolite transporter (DMT)-like permease
MTDAVVLALAAACLWGTGDFLGGLASRRAKALVVVFWSQLAGMAGLVVWLLLSGAHAPDAAHSLAAVGAGVAGAIGLACLYRGMAIGAMGIVAPISATAPLVPLAVDAARGTSPTQPQWLGITFALAGVMLVSREPGSGILRPTAGVSLALAAALGFGLFFVGLGVAAQDGPEAAATAARVGAVGFVIVSLTATRTSTRIARRIWPLVLTVGIFDTSANVLMAFAATLGSIGAVAVLSSLYPLATIALARMVLHERLGPTRTAGGLVALVGAALVAAG